MRGARRLTIACLAAGLMLGPTVASAQDAAATNSTAAQAVGPRELQNFSLQGNVTRPADQPAEQPATAPVASTDDDRPATPAPAARQPARERTASAQPTVTAPRTATPSRGEPARATASVEQPAQAPADAALLTRPAPTPASAPAFAPPPLASSDTLAPEPGFSLLPWLLAALALAAGGLLLFWRNRSQPALAGGPKADFFKAPEAKPVRWLTPELEPKPVPRPAPSPTPEAAPQPPRAETTPSPVGVVSTGLRPWVEIAVQPLRCTVTDTNVTFELELELFNSGSAPARDILVEAVVVNAGEDQDQALATFFARPPGPGQRIDVIHALNRTAFVTQVVIAREHVHGFNMQGREVFVPLLAFNAFYRRGSGEAQSSVAYLVGPATKAEKLAPFRLDLGARLFEGLAARLLPLGIRK